MEVFDSIEVQIKNIFKLIENRLDQTVGIFFN